MVRHELTTEEKRVIWNAAREVGFAEVVESLGSFAHTLSEQRGGVGDTEGVLTYNAHVEALNEAGQKIRAARNPQKKRRGKLRRSIS